MLLRNIESLLGIVEEWLLKNNTWIPLSPNCLQQDPGQPWPEALQESFHSLK